MFEIFSFFFGFLAEGADWLLMAAAEVLSLGGVIVGHAKRRHVVGLGVIVALFLREVASLVDSPADGVGVGVEVGNVPIQAL